MHGLTFVGVPVTTTFDLLLMYFSASLNPSNILSNFFSKNLVAFPGYALLSCINVGIPNLCAAVIAPPQIYPPVPITISGLNSLTIFLLLQILLRFLNYLIRF